MDAYRRRPSERLVEFGGRPRPPCRPSRSFLVSRVDHRGADRRPRGGPRARGAEGKAFARLERQARYQGPPRRVFQGRAMGEARGRRARRCSAPCGPRPSDEEPRVPRRSLMSESYIGPRDCPNTKMPAPRRSRTFQTRRRSRLNASSKGNPTRPAGSFRPGAQTPGRRPLDYVFLTLEKEGVEKFRQVPLRRTSSRRPRPKPRTSSRPGDHP